MNIKLSDEMVDDVIVIRLKEIHKHLDISLAQTVQSNTVIGIFSFKYEEEVREIQEHLKALRLVLEYFGEYVCE